MFSCLEHKHKKRIIFIIVIMIFQLKYSDKKCQVIIPILTIIISINEY